MFYIKIYLIKKKYYIFYSPNSAFDTALETEFRTTQKLEKHIFIKINKKKKTKIIYIQFNILSSSMIINLE